MRNAALVAVLALALLPAAAAQGPQDPFTIVSAAQPGPIAYAGTANVTVTVGAGCANALQAAAASGSQTPTARVSVRDPPAWLTFTELSIELPVANCVSATNPTGSGYVAQSGSLQLRVTPEAPGIVFQTINVTATLPGPNNAPQTDEESLAINVTYRANHTIRPSITFPATMTGRTLNFTVTVTYGANAPGMVMFENVAATGGSVSGLASTHFSPGQTKEFAVTYTAPSTTWNETTISFRAFSHYLINATNDAGSPMLVQDYAWVVRNGNPDGAPDAETSPLGASHLAALVLAAALVALRRRA